jgi:hypothetical protein
MLQHHHIPGGAIRNRHISSSFLKNDRNSVIQERKRITITNPDRPRAIQTKALRPRLDPRVWNQRDSGPIHLDPDMCVGLNSILRKNMYLAITWIHSAHFRSTPIRVEIHQLHHWLGTARSLLATALVLSSSRSSQMNGGDGDGDGAALPPPPPLPSPPLPSPLYPYPRI